MEYSPEGGIIKTTGALVLRTSTRGWTLVLQIPGPVVTRLIVTAL
jgi:hypothetical protein